MHSSNNLPPCRRAGADATCVPGGRRSRRATHRQHDNVADDVAYHFAGHGDMSADKWEAAAASRVRRLSEVR
eukprot:scaffold30947_cov105-Phaeocystis_antarctica.AAC.1